MDDPQRSPRPIGVTILGSALLVGAFIGVAFCAFGLFIVTIHIDSEGLLTKRGFDSFEAFALTLLVGIAALCALAAAAGRGFLKGDAWARWVIMLAAVVGIVWAGVSLLVTLAQGYADLAPYTLPPIAGCAVVLWLLLRPDAKRWFA